MAIIQDNPAYSITGHLIDLRERVQTDHGHVCIQVWERMELLPGEDQPVVHLIADQRYLEVLAHLNDVELVLLGEYCAARIARVDYHKAFGTLINQRSHRVEVYFPTSIWEKVVISNFYPKSRTDWLSKRERRPSNEDIISWVAKGHDGYVQCIVATESEKDIVQSK